MEETFSKIRIGSVSYLNSVPLVWGMLHGPQRVDVDLSFSIPSVCAEQVESGEIEAGLVPVAEIARQGLEMAPGVGIACFGAVRSILLFSRVPWHRVRTLAADLSSRTSVQLARVILRERFGAEPEIAARRPQLEEMLSEADAALLIGDPALCIRLENHAYEYLDLGAEWLTLTGLPFVFAAWAGKPGLPLARLTSIVQGSYAFGKAHLSDIVEQEYAARGISKELAGRYLSHYIHFELGRQEQEGLDTFLQLADLDKPALAAGS